MADFSPVSNAHPEYIENLYISYRKDPNAIDPSWSYFFNGFDYANENGNSTTNGSTNGHAAVVTAAPVSLGMIPQKEVAVMMLIDGYRHRAHLLSTTNPIKSRRDRQPHLLPKEYGLTDEDMSKTFAAGETLGLKNATLKQIIDRLEGIYVRGVQPAHLPRAVGIDPNPRVARSPRRFFDPGVIRGILRVGALRKFPRVAVAIAIRIGQRIKGIVGIQTVGGFPIVWQAVVIEIGGNEQPHETLRG